VIDVSRPTAAGVHRRQLQRSRWPATSTPRLAGVINSTAYNSRSSNVGSRGAQRPRTLLHQRFPVTNPLATSVPTLGFDSIAQQQVLLRLRCRIRRSTGGVTSPSAAPLKGAYAIYTPAPLRSDYWDIYYPDTGSEPTTHYNTAGNNW
jgi:hypothetical protein